MVGSDSITYRHDWTMTATLSWGNGTVTGTESLWGNAPLYNYSGTDYVQEGLTEIFRGLRVTFSRWKELIHLDYLSMPIKRVVKPHKVISHLKKRMQINQPCWSAKRWKSLT